MKKSIKIAALGVAALGFAAAPVAGVFAADNVSITDSLTVTIGDNCSFERTTGTGTYTATMTPGQLNSSVGSSTYKVICNNSKGYSVGATFTGLTGNQSPTPDAIAYSATTPTSGSGTWTATKTTAAGNIAATNGVLMESAAVTAAAGETETVTYQVGTSATQAQGSYTGSAVYKFVQK